jgi:uncharacterized protein YdhG (YjbR/CyaY superfamily)
MSDRVKFSTIDQYLASAADEARPILDEIRRIVHEVAPQAEETISYQLPAFKQGRVFVYFAAFKQHIGLYPPVNGDPALMAELKPYSNEKGNLRFPLHQPLPYDLIRRVVAALLSQYGS